MKFTITKKIWMALSAILAIIVIINCVAFYALDNVKGRYNNLIEQDVQRINYAHDLEIAQKDLAKLLVDFVSLNKVTAKQGIQEEIDRGIAAANSLKEVSKDKSSLELLNQLSEKTLLLNDANKLVIELKESNGDYSVAQLSSMQLSNDILKILDEVIEVQEQNIETTRNEIAGFQKNTERLIITISIIALFLSLGISYVLSRNISKPVGRITDSLEEIAQGNLSIESLHIKNKDEIGKMGASFNKMLEDLRGIVTSVSDSSMQVAANAQELSASSEQSLASSQMVAKSAENQLHTSTEQSHFMNASIDSMNELRSSIDQISGDNEKMLHSTNDVKTLIDQGATSIKSVVSQMETIHGTFKDTTVLMRTMEQHSNSIQNITSLITDIADQTNLLALNASIEAARAGEHGKGFAVVAEEVRKLAEQTKDSAIEIESMVEQIQQTSSNATKTIVSGGVIVDEGMNKTTESLHVFKNIESGIGEVVYRVQSVSAAVEEIQAMTGSVIESVQHVQQLATKTADTASDTSAATEEQLAATEEISSNAQSLSDLAEKLQYEVNHFKL